MIPFSCHKKFWRDFFRPGPLSAWSPLECDLLLDMSMLWEASATPTDFFSPFWFLLFYFLTKIRIKKFQKKKWIHAHTLNILESLGIDISRVITKKVVSSLTAFNNAPNMGYHSQGRVKWRHKKCLSLILACFTMWPSNFINRT